jgi:hypothetical protein
MGSALTRRRFLGRSAAAALALGAAGFGGSEWLRASAGTTGLSRARRRTYIALVDAVGRGSRSQVDPAQTAVAARWLADFRAQSLEPTRTGIDDVLDRLERVPAGRPFSALGPAQRLEILRTLADRDDELADSAVELAAAPFHPPAAGYHGTPVML